MFDMLCPSGELFNTICRSFFERKNMLHDVYLTVLCTSGVPQMETVMKKPVRHFVLVHGLCHGAWCWYRVATVLRTAGHSVTAPDLAACGASPVRVDEVRSFAEYSRPLTDAVAAVPPGEKVVLVGHSYGGYSLALAMEAHPDKVAVAVFVAAAMPAAGCPMSHLLSQIMEETATDAATDSVPAVIGAAETFLLGPERLSRRLYQRSPAEDLALATALVRPARWFLGDAAMTESVLTADRYGAVRRACVVTEEDATWAAESQRRMASRCPGVEVAAVEGADHMPMLSTPHQLAAVLMEIADKYI
ncbi:probable esterase PIR7A [Triticum urartu]|nr:probable esterase PIR7A [Triticum urartu]